MMCWNLHGKLQSHYIDYCYLVLQTPVLNVSNNLQSEYNSQTSSARVCKTCLCTEMLSFGFNSWQISFSTSSSSSLSSLLSSLHTDSSTVTQMLMQIAPVC